jgi:RNA polymerase sigma factor (sigma-70 family)
MNSTSTSPPKHGAEFFATTHWSVVLTAQGVDARRAQAALAQLCQAYWYPLYAFVRRQGYRPEDAQDLTQEFFARLLAANSLAGVHPEKGRFRSFLLASLKYFLANEWDRAHAAKRGGGQALLSLDDSEAENRYRLEPADTLSADRIFERRWALTLLEQVLQRLRQDYTQAGKEVLFEELKGALVGASATAPYVQMAGRLNMSEGAVKVAVHRLRRRYRELLRQEIAQTVASETEVEDEIRHILAILTA